MSIQAGSTAAPTRSGPWIYGPWLDLIVGCGAWSAPLLVIAAWLTPSHEHGWAVAFYFLALAFNFPHFMATVYRAYHTRAEFEKYQIFTLHFTLLLLITGILAHAFYWLVPWIFTLYICWSPWHYSGQNFGLLMMFVRRNGATTTPEERRWIRTAFVSSFLMLLAAFETGGSTDPLVLSLGLPSQFTLLLRLLLGVVFIASSFLGFRGLVRRTSWRAMAAPLTLALTQFLWFVLPTLLELNAAYRIPQTRYSSGILAVLHSAQYLWITSYYQRREARATTGDGWRLARYFLVLAAGGIALFIPGPWLVSRIFHFDFTTSFLIFTAVVNIHHFVLDGALWKLRDTRVVSLLVDRDAKAQPSHTQVRPETHVPRAGTRSTAWFQHRNSWLTGFGVLLIVLLFVVAGMDQIHFALGTAGEELPSLLIAARMNPYDSVIQSRIASLEAKENREADAVSALTRAVEINPHSAALQHAFARALIENGRYQEAYDRYAKILKLFPRDCDALVNYGLLAARLGHPEQAAASWEKALEIDPNQPNPHLYLAEALDQQGVAADAIPHWEAYLRLASAHADDPAAGITREISARIQLGDDESRIHRTDLAFAAYQSAIERADQGGQSQLESLGLAHLADLQEAGGDFRSASGSYQRGLALDQKAGDAHGAAFDWFNYGQFLRRRGVPDEVTYACFLEAESLLASTPGHDLETVKSIRLNVEDRLGKRAAGVQKNLPVLLARATAVDVSSQGR